MDETASRYGNYELLNKQSRTAYKGRYLTWGVGEGLTPHRKMPLCYGTLQGPWTLTGFLKRPRQRKMDMIAWSLYRAGSLKTVASELAKCNLEPVAV